MNVAIIPARGGSKRIPKKNIKAFSGMPMIAYAITAALESKLFEKVVVSTDDQDIAAIAKKWGADVPFIRPSELADDHTPTVPVIAHAIKTLKAQGVFCEYACCIFAVAPFIRTEDLIAALNLLKTSGAQYCYPVTEFPSPIQRALRRYKDSRIEPINPENEWVRTQDLESTYFDTGQFYWGKVSAWLEGLGLQSCGSGLLIPPWRVVDIDTAEDWQRAELMHKVLNGTPK